MLLEKVGLAAAVAALIIITNIIAITNGLTSIVSSSLSFHDRPNKNQHLLNESIKQHLNESMKRAKRRCPGASKLVRKMA